MHWADIIFTLDVSKSMDTRDMTDGSNQLSRLEIMRKFVIDTITNHPENRYGIIIFAGTSLISSPLTTDSEVLTDIVSSLDSKTIREGWTNIEDALKLSVDRFSDTKDPKTLVFMSDGWEPDDISSWDSINTIIHSGKNINFTIFWLWTDAGGQIPIGQDLFWNPIYKTQDGRDVVSKLGRENLERLASISNTNVTYINSSWDEGKFDSILNASLKRNYLQTTKEQDDSSTRILLFISSLFLLASMLIIKSKK